MAEICLYDLELKEMVRTKLESEADGMFLWVSLVVQELLDTPIRFVSEALETTPRQPKRIVYPPSQTTEWQKGRDCNKNPDLDCHGSGANDSNRARGCSLSRKYS